MPAPKPMDFVSTALYCIALFVLILIQGYLSMALPFGIVGAAALGLTFALFGEFVCVPIIYFAKPKWEFPLVMASVNMIAAVIVHFILLRKRLTYRQVVALNYRSVVNLEK